MDFYPLRGGRLLLWYIVFYSEVALTLPLGSSVYDDSAVRIALSGLTSGPGPENSYYLTLLSLALLLYAILVEAGDRCRVSTTVLLTAELQNKKSGETVIAGIGSCTMEFLIQLTLYQAIKGGCGST